MLHHVQSLLLWQGQEGQMVKLLKMRLQIYLWHLDDEQTPLQEDLKLSSEKDQIPGQTR